jgi:serine/threonine protein kinase
VKFSHTKRDPEKLEAEKRILSELRSQPHIHRASGQYIVQFLGNGIVSTAESTLRFHDGCDRIFPPPTTQICGLVLESGGPNLFQFYSRLNNKPDVLRSINILKEVREAVEFIHECGIIHGDLKPENIVCFSYLESGLLRWKLIDFDTSCRENKDEFFVKEEFSFTPEYASPEVRKFVKKPEQFPLPKLRSLDIWSLGIIAFFIFAAPQHWDRILERLKRCSFQEEIDKILSTFADFEDKEKSFVKSCLQIDPRNRCDVSSLSNKTLFSTQPSTIQANAFRDSNEEVHKLLKELYHLRNESTTQDMTQQLNEFYDCLIPQLTQLLAMNREDILDFLRHSFPLPSPTVA